MADDFRIIDLSTGRFRAERRRDGGDALSYASATFSTRRQAREWIAAQVAAPADPVAASYAITISNTKTYQVSRRQGDRAEWLGEFDTMAEAEGFVSHMQQYDLRQSSGA